MCHMSYEEATPEQLSMWECILYVYYLCGGTHCMFNFMTIIKPTIIPSIRRVCVYVCGGGGGGGDYCSMNQTLYVLSG